jgi:hypothetical protein
MNTLSQEVQIGLILGDSHKEMGCLPAEVSGNDCPTCQSDISPCWSAYLVTIVTFHYHTLELGKRPQNQPNQENQRMLKVGLAKRITTVCYY